MLKIISEIPHREKFMKQHFMYTIFHDRYGMNTDLKSHLIEFIQSWKIPPNAHKFIKYDNWFLYKMFLLAVREPYGDLPTLSSVFEVVNEYSFTPFSTLRCNIFGEPEM